MHRTATGTKNYPAPNVSVCWGTLKSNGNWIWTLLLLLFCELGRWIYFQSLLSHLKKHYTTTTDKQNPAFQGNCERPAKRLLNRVLSTLGPNTQIRAQTQRSLLKQSGSRVQTCHQKTASIGFSGTEQKRWRGSKRTEQHRQRTRRGGIHWESGD